MANAGPIRWSIDETYCAERMSWRSRWKHSAMQKWIDDHRKEIAFIGFILIGIILALVAEHLESLPKWFGTATASLGDALIVAGLLGLTVDHFLKKSLIRDVGAIFIGWALPQEVRNYIREVSQTDIVRKDLRVRYDLSKVGDTVVARISMEWDVFNYGTSTKMYSSMLAIDLTDKPDDSQTTCNVTIGEKSLSWNAEKFEKDGLVGRTGHVITWKSGPKSFRLLPQNADDPGTKPACRVRWSYVQRMPVPYTDLVAIMAPTIGVEITARCPSDIEFICGDEPIHAKGSDQWSYHRLYMTGQSIRVWWRRKESQAPVQSRDITPMPTPQSDQVHPSAPEEQATP